MPFIEQPDEADEWVVKTEVQLRQLDPARHGSWWKTVARFLYGRKVMFEVLETFGHQRGGRPFDRPLREDTVVAGTSTDLASVPSFLWGVIPSYGGHTLAAVLHDSQCIAAEYVSPSRPGGPRTRRPMAQRLALRRRADDLFRYVLVEESGSGPATGWMMWAAVRAFGSPASRIATAAVLGLAGIELLPLALDTTWTQWLVEPGSASLLGGPLVDRVRLVLLAALVVGLLLASNEEVGITPDPDGMGGRLRAIRSMAAAMAVIVVAFVPIAVTAVTSWIVSRSLSILDFLVDLVWGSLPSREAPTRAPAARPAPVAPVAPAAQGDDNTRVTAR